MFDEIGVNLPAMRLVCHLVALSNITSPVTDPVPAVTQSPPQKQSINELPAGYVAYPDIGLAYKHYNRTVKNWVEAKNLCLQEGAQLAVIDSAQKVKYLRRQIADYVPAGIILVDGHWINVNTGLPILSIPWKSGYPQTASTYAALYRDYDGITNFLFSSGYEMHYACERRILRNFTISAN